MFILTVCLLLHEIPAAVDSVSITTRLPAVAKITAFPNAQHLARPFPPTRTKVHAVVAAKIDNT